MTARLIGIGGRLAAGKDAVADHLVTKHGFVKLGMSDPLLDAALVLDPIVECFDEAMGGPERLSEVVKRDGYVEAKKIPEVRRFLQVLGTDFGRKMIDENVWVDIARRTITDHLIADRLVVITGLRFSNEITMIEDLGGETWWVDRSDHEVGNSAAAHASENGVQAFDFQRVIYNRASLGDLYAVVNRTMARDNARHGIALTATEALELDEALHQDFPTTPISIQPERTAA